VEVDLRITLDVEPTPYGIPGACRIAPKELDGPDPLIPKDSEVVFYCAEPTEARSARRALLLDSHGYKHVQPLSGGLEGWRKAGFPVEPIPAPHPTLHKVQSHFDFEPPERNLSRQEKWSARVEMTGHALTWAHRRR